MEPLRLSVVPAGTPSPGHMLDGDGLRAAALPERARSALALLLDAHAYAEDLSQDVWEFAVRIPSLRKLGLTECDLRWLVGKGFVEHGREVAVSDHQERTFRRGAKLNFAKRTCVVLTEAGVAYARGMQLDERAQASGSRAEPSGTVEPSGSVEATRTKPVAPPTVAAGSDPMALVPRWDRDLQELRLGKQLIKQFKVPAPNQEMVLAVFEEEHWPQRIDDPLPPADGQDPKRRLHDTIVSLNRHRKCGRVRFYGDGSGQGVRWALIDDESNQNRDGPPDLT